MLQLGIVGYSNNTNKGQHTLTWRDAFLHRATHTFLFTTAVNGLLFPYQAQLSADAAIFLAFPFGLALLVLFTIALLTL